MSAILAFSTARPVFVSSTIGKLLSKSASITLFSVVFQVRIIALILQSVSIQMATSTLLAMPTVQKQLVLPVILDPIQRLTVLVMRFLALSREVHWELMVPVRLLSPVTVTAKLTASGSLMICLDRLLKMESVPPTPIVQVRQIKLEQFFIFSIPMERL